MKCVVVDMRNRLFGDAISGSLQHFDSGFRVYQTEGTAAEDLCVDTHADVLVAEVTAYPPWRLEQRLDLCRRLRQGLPAAGWRWWWMRCASLNWRTRCGGRKRTV